MYIMVSLLDCSEFGNFVITLIYNQKSENIDFKGLAEVINKLIFNKIF